MELFPALSAGQAERPRGRSTALWPKSRGRRARFMMPGSLAAFAGQWRAVRGSVLAGVAGAARAEGLADSP